MLTLGFQYQLGDTHAVPDHQHFGAIIAERQHRSAALARFGVEGRHHYTARAATAVKLYTLMFIVIRKSSSVTSAYLPRSASLLV